MPPASVFQVLTELGEPKLVGTLSFRDNWTFADARLKMEQLGLVDFEFQFMDLTPGSRMQFSWEKGILVEDCGGRITIIPKSQGLVCRRSSADGARGGTDSVIDIGSSHASNTHSSLPSLSESQQWDLMASSRSDEACPVIGPVESVLYPVGSPVQDSIDPLEDRADSEARDPAPPADPNASFESILMSNELKKQWSTRVDKLKQHMVARKIDHHKWKARTWDEGNVVFGKIECLECDTRHNGASKGTMTDRSIRNCFTNFREKHLMTPKHIQATATNRGQQLSDVEVAKRVADNTLDYKAIYDEHVKIVDAINLSQGGSQQTFKILANLEKEPYDLHKFKLLCTYCRDEYAMIPRQRNLETNLRFHCGSSIHTNCVAKSQLPSTREPVLSGRPGRPRQADKRDVKQRLIGGFFSTRPSEIGTGVSTSQGTSGLSTAPSTAASSERLKGIHDNFPLLCWGLWRDVVQYNGESRPVQEILQDQVRLDGTWYPEPLARAEVLCQSTGQVCGIDGTFRSKNCSRISTLDGGFQDLTCHECFSIKIEKDFRLRVLRELTASEKRGSRGTGNGRNLRYLTIPEVQRQSQKYRLGITREIVKSRKLQHRLCMLRMRSPSLREICSEASNQRDVYKFCNAIVLARRKGAFGGREAVWDLLKDIVLNLCRKGPGNRYSKGSKLIAQTLFQHGGRRVVDCMLVNGIGPSLNTLQRDKRGMHVFHAGLHEEQFKVIAQVYSKIKKRLGITCPVPVFMAEDETCVKKTIRWQPKHDTLLGFCGVKESPEEAHRCVSGLELKVGDGESGFENITSAFDKHVIGHQARVIMVNPMHESFPRLCILATATCNQFDAEWVREQWNVLEKLSTTHCLEAVGPCLGHASDGDSRRRKLMLEDYTGRGELGPRPWPRPRPRQNIGWAGWVLIQSFTTGHPSVPGSVHAVGLHDQDYIHNGKKLVNPLDSCVRILKLGPNVATLSHLGTVRALYGVEVHGMNVEDILRTDRQNWASAQRLCSRKVRQSLQLLRLRPEVTRETSLGTEVYIRICGDYMDIFMNLRLSLRQRIVLCGKVGLFFRLWRLWCFYGDHGRGGNAQPIDFAYNCIPMQTFIDIQMSMHFAVLLIIQFRDHYRQLPLPLHLTGSDSCEQFFSKVGGMIGHERSYGFDELVDCATSLNRMAALDLVEGMRGAGKSHKKHKNIWMKLHPVENETKADLTDYTGIETNEDVVVALQEGFAQAQSAATELDMHAEDEDPRTPWWSRPWEVEARGVKKGGWCDIDVTNMGDTDRQEGPASVSSTQSGAQRPAIGGSSQFMTPVGGCNVEMTDGVANEELATDRGYRWSA